MHESSLILWFLLGAVAVTGLGAFGRFLFTPERRAARGLRRDLGARPDMVLAGADGASAAISLDAGRITVRRAPHRAAETFDSEDLVGVELVAEGQVIARSWRGEPRKALDRTPEAPARLDLRLSFAHAAAAEIVLVAWDAAQGRPQAERDAAVEAARRWFAQMDAAIRAPRRPPPPANRKDEDA